VLNSKGKSYNRHERARMEVQKQNGGIIRSLCVCYFLTAHRTLVVLHAVYKLRPGDERQAGHLPPTVVHSARLDSISRKPSNK